MFYELYSLVVGNADQCEIETRRLGSSALNAHAVCTSVFDVKSIEPVGRLTFDPGSAAAGKNRGMTGFVLA